jgi:hypothetical protein
MDIIEAVAKTRKKAATIASDALASCDGCSEVEIRDRMLASQATDTELYESGWYDPPEGGASVLIGKERMAFDSLRKQEFWPRDDIVYQNNLPMFVYLSPVDRFTKMIGDFGLTVYSGEDEEMRKHIRKGLAAILRIAESAAVGMSLEAVHDRGLEILSEYGLAHARISTITPGAGESNFGHTVPWSDGEAAPEGKPMAKLKEDIRIARKFLSPGEQYQIRPTCAFTVESRMMNPQNPELPNIFFHVIVTFSNGEKQLHADFNDIFRENGMDYML